MPRRPGRPRTTGDREQHQPAGDHDPGQQQAQGPVDGGKFGANAVAAGVSAEVEGGHATGSSAGPASDPALAGDWPPMPLGRVTIRARTSGSFNSATRSSSAAFGAAASAPETAMLDQDADGVARVVIGREGDEPRVVLERPGDVVGLARSRAVGMGLSRPGLSRHLHRAEVEVDFRGRRAAGVVGHRGHGRAHEGDVFRLNIQTRRLGA